MSKGLGTACAFGVMITLYLLAVGIVLAAPRPQTPRWTYTQCMTNECVSEALNKLSIERAAEAKLTTWQHWTYVWYRE